MTTTPPPMPEGWTPPLGLHYSEDSATRVAGTFVVDNPVAGVPNAATYDGQVQLNHKLQDKGWISAEGKVLTPLHLGDVPEPARVVDADAGIAVTVVRFDYHIRADPRCRCGPEHG